MKELPQLTVLDLAKMAKGVYREPPPRTVLGSATFVFESHATDTQGYCVCLNIHGIKVAVIVFRGSKGRRDWLRDLYVASCSYRGREHLKVHAMAMASWESVDRQVLDFIEAENPKRIFVTGHSLGGELCTPCADGLYATLGKFSTRVTFGALPFGKAAFVDYMKKAPYLKHYRFVVGKDIATANAFHNGLFGYRHDAPKIRLTPWWDLRRLSSHSIDRDVWELERELYTNPFKWQII